MFLFFAVIISLAILSIAYLALYFLYKWLSKRGYKIIGLAIFVTFSLYLGYSIYMAIYPTDSFYFSEFKEVTQRDTPESATIINKAASYPDFHGDYCSASLISVSTADYSKLLNELNHDKRLTSVKADQIIGSDELTVVIRGYKKDQITYSFTRSIAGEEDHYLFIGFLDDKKTIVVSVCVT